MTLLIDPCLTKLSSPTEWNLIFALIRSTMPHPEAARLSFDLITDLASEGPKYHVTMDNSSSLVLLLDEFATAAGIFTETQQFRNRRKEPMTSAKYVPSLYLSRISTAVPCSSPVVARAKKAIDLIANLNRQLPLLLETSNVSGEQGIHSTILSLQTDHLMDMQPGNSHTYLYLRHWDDSLQMLLGKYDMQPSHIYSVFCLGLEWLLARTNRVKWKTYSTVSYSL